MFYSWDWKKIFIRMFGTLLVLLPVLLAFFIFIEDPSKIVYSFFALLTEMALVLGIIIDIENTEMHSVISFVGLLISLIIGVIFSWNYKIHNGLVSFFIYYWVWLSLYSAGLQLSVKYVEYEKLFNSFVIVLGGVATLSWYWFSFFF
ncbi:MAG: hypothetical protein QXY45_03155 [Candidatus Aenigmatarchaeota archaeon]